MTAETIFDIAQPGTVAIEGDARRFPVRRIFCVGRNYAAHAAEMGNEVDREAPFYFIKSVHDLCASGQKIPYPPGTSDCHYEMEFVIALGGAAFQVNPDEAMDAIFGYACGIDLTRRDLQQKGKDKRRPWDLGKDFENSAIMGAITPVTTFGSVTDQAISLLQNGEIVQSAQLSEMVWSVREMISHLSQYYHLEPGDLIYTGTPAGVGPVQPGDVLQGAIEGLAPISVTIGEAE